MVHAIMNSSTKEPNESWRATTAERTPRPTSSGYRKFYFRPRILWNYASTLISNPTNIQRLGRGFTALVRKNLTPVDSRSEPRLES